MALNTQFSIAVHLMAGLGYFSKPGITSTDLAESVNTSPSFVRRILAKLSKAGLIGTLTGKAGACWLARRPGDISLLQIYRAIGSPKALAIHTYPVEKRCPVSCHIKPSLEKVSSRVQSSLEDCLGGITLSAVIADLNKNENKHHE